MSNVLIIAAHPDDETLGCAGTIQYHRSIGDTVVVLMMTADKNLRYPDNPSKLAGDIAAVQTLLGWNDTIFQFYQDQGLDLIRLTEVAQVIEQTIRANNIDTVYTHHYGDVNKDHRMCYEATITACRPTPTCTVDRLLTYWVPSSSEWMSYDDNNAFKPNWVIDLGIEDRLEKKIQAMKLYESEVRQYPHPRSEKGIRLYAETFGMKFGREAVEPFQLLYDRRAR